MSAPLSGRADATSSFSEVPSRAATPRRWKLYLHVGLQEVVEHVHRDGEVPSVEGVGAIPPLGPKLSSFCHHGVKVTKRKEDALKLCLPGTQLQGVLKGNVAQC